MAGSSLLTLLDDIAVLLDDIALMTKLAAQKTVGVLGDDLALNAEQIQGVSAKRELPVVYAVAKGSLRNKAILVPVAMLLSVFAPWAIMPLLMIGGAYLCFEGAEKLWHSFHSTPGDKVAHAAELAALLDGKTDMVAYEKDKIRGAIRTDFILSAEIIVITLSIVATRSYAFQAAILVGMSILMTVGVYGLVGGIIKLDDAGLHLQKSANAMTQLFGKLLFNAAAPLMKLLSVVGTAAMFMVGGEFLVHGIPAVYHALEPHPWYLQIVGNSIVGLAIGALIVLIINSVSKFRPKVSS
jgi:predicted DNA repair protein MutK